MNLRLLPLFAGLGIALVSGCSEDPAGPTGGALDVNLASANSDDGGVLFTVSGGVIDSVTSSDYQVYSARLDPNTLRVIVTGNLNAGTIARLHVPDIRRASNFSITLNQVAARGSYLQRDAAAYSVSMEQQH
jgi:hypothetical protein